MMMWKNRAFTLEAINCMPQYYFLTVNKSSTKLVHLLVIRLYSNQYNYLCICQKKKRKEREKNRNYVKCKQYILLGSVNTSIQRKSERKK